MLSLLLPFLAVPVLSIPLWIAVAAGDDVVARARVERFAAKHRLTITVQNGAQVIEYLAATRRWRAFGLAAGLVVSAALSLSLSLSDITVNALALVAGWFAGALAAEIHLARPAFAGPIRKALVMRRNVEDYLPRLPRLLVPLATATCLAAGAFTRDLLWTCAGIAVAAVVWFTQRRVLGRPQPFDEPDRLAADDAIRSRSARVLAGAGFALIMYCVLAQLHGFETVVLLGMVLVPIAGFLVAL